MTPRMAILISGRGSNMEALARRCIAGDLAADIAFVGSDRERAPGLEIARSLGLATAVFPYEELGRPRAEGQLEETLRSEAVSWVVLAGFMRVLSAPFVSAFANSIVNIHPSLLPAFPGMRSIREAYDHGVRVTGVTVHLVDRQVDHGPILAQEPVRVHDGDTLGTLEERIHATEHDLYWRTLRDLFAGAFKLDGRRRMVRDQAPSFAVRME